MCSKNIKDQYYGFRQYLSQFHLEFCHLNNIRSNFSLSCNYLSTTIYFEYYSEMYSSRIVEVKVW